MYLLKSPRNIKQPEDAQGQLSSLREKILTSLLYGGLLIVIFPALQWVVPAIQTRNIPVLIIAGVLYLLLVVVTLFRTLPYNLRTTYLQFLLFFFGVIGIAAFGLGPYGIAFLLTFSVVTGVLRSFRASIFAIGSSIGAILLVIVLIQLKAIPATTTNQMQPNEWFYGTTLFALASLLSVIALSRLIDGLEFSLKHSQMLTQQLQVQQEVMEQNIQKRTRELERRLSQIRAASDINRLISSMLDQQTILNQVAEIIRERYNLYYVGVFLVDETNEYAVLRAGTGEAGEKMLAAKHRLAIGLTSMIGWAIANLKPRIALDVGAEAVRFRNPYLPLTRSEVAIPLIARDKAIGALTLQSALPQAFDEGDLLALQSVADGFAIALENARLFEQTQASLIEIRELHQQYMSDAWKQVSYSEGNLSYAVDAPHPTVEEEQTKTLRVPMLLRDQMLGEFTLEIDKDEISPEEMTFLDSIATQTALALENARLFSESRRRTNQELTLNRLSAQFSRAVDIDSILKTAVRELAQIPSVSDVSIQLSASIEDNPGQSPIDLSEHIN